VEFDRDQPPDYIEPVIGWRVWRTRTSNDGTALVSAFHDHRWPFRQHADAVCHAFKLPWRNRHLAPEEGCRCGIYGVAAETFAQGSSSLGPPGVYFPVLGPVAMWGKVVVTRHGWRAEFAYPQQLFVPVLGRRRHAARRLADNLASYGVPVHLLDTPAESLAEDFGEIRRLAAAS